MKPKIVYESDDSEEINELFNSTEWCMPRWSESKRKYIMVRKASSLKQA